jgi:hypothetical protein
MPNTIVNLKILDIIATQYETALRDSNAVSLRADGTAAEDADPADIDAIVGALRTVSERISRICQQPVLAIRLTER